jgi:hypothetical protein
MELLYGCGALKAGTIIDPNEKDEIVLRNLGSAAINSFMKGIPALKNLRIRLLITLQLVVTLLDWMVDHSSVDLISKD